MFEKGYNKTIKAFLVGVSDYSFFQRGTDLPFCKNDILLFARALMYGLRVNPDQIYLLGYLNEHVTVDDFKYLLMQYCQKIQAGDTFLFYFSGHGGNDENARHYLKFSDGYVYTNFLVDMFENLPAKNIILVFDTCCSGNIEISRASATIDESTWLNGFIERGCAVFSSSSADEKSWNLPRKQISLFTSFLSEAILNKYLIRNGQKSLEQIRENVFMRVKAWNEQNPEIAQNPVYRSNVGGAIMFPVEKHKPYPVKEYYASHDDYIIFKVDPVHNSIAKRYSVKVILKHPVTLQELASINHLIVDELREADIYQNEQSEKVWHGRKTNIVFSFFGHDESDVVNSNYEYISTWVDSSQNKEWWYRKTKDGELINGIIIRTNRGYEMLKKFTQEHTAEANELVQKTKIILGRMISLAEVVRSEYQEMLNCTLTEEQLIDKLQPTLSEIEGLYFKVTDLEIPPIELHEWSLLCTSLAGFIHDFTFFYGKQYLSKRTPENRKQCMNMTIKHYQQGLVSLKKEEERLHLDGGSS